MKTNQVVRKFYGYLEINDREDLIPYFGKKIKRFQKKTTKDEFWKKWKEMFMEEGLTLSQTEDLMNEIQKTSLSYRSKESSIHINNFKHIIPGTQPIEGGTGGSLK